MKKTVFFSASILFIVFLFYWVFGSGTGEVISKSMTVGTIKVCWSSTCTSSVETTVVLLIDSNGNTVGTCTINPPESCCKIQGDFPTGSYHFKYYRPTGVSDCKTGEFDYINGTNVTLEVICRCP